MRSLRFCASAVASLAILSGSASGIDGPVAPEPGEPGYIAAFEAVAGWGRTKNLEELGGTSDEHNIFCSGVLVAPNMVITARHCKSISWPNGVLIGPSDPGMTYTDPLTQIVHPAFTVRFRMNSNGDIGTLAGGQESFYQVPIKYMIAAPEPNMDIMLLILADDENDTGVWSNGWITHITPLPITPFSHDYPVPHEAFGVSYGPVPNPVTCVPADFLPNTKGTLRVRSMPEAYTFAASSPNLPGNIAQEMANLPDCLLAKGDSGGIISFLTESGEYIVSNGFEQGGGSRRYLNLPFSQAWDLFFNPPINSPYSNTPVLLPYSELDVTKSAGPLTADWGEGNWKIDLNDVIAMASGQLPLSVSDLDNDGTYTINDFKIFITQLSVLDHPYAPYKLFPLLPGAADIDGDGRFALEDTLLLSSLISSGGQLSNEMDFNGDGSVDQDDLDILTQVLQATVSGFGALFDNGIFADANDDSQYNCLDTVAFQAALPLFDGSVVSGATGYTTDLDYDFNHILDIRDAAALSARLLPGDISTNFHIRDPSTLGIAYYNSNFQYDIFDIRKFMAELSMAVLLGAPAKANDIGVDLVETNWLPGTTTAGPDGVFSRADAVYAVTHWAGSCAGSIQTTVQNQFWQVDVNNDGRLNILDMRELESIMEWYQSQQIPFFWPDWDLVDDGVIDIKDIDELTKIVYVGSPFGQGFLGDYDKSASPECACPQQSGKVSESRCEDQSDNICATPQITIQYADCADLTGMLNDPRGGISFLFGSGITYSNLDYIPQLDADLDGDMDDDDKVIIFRMLQPGDLDYNGVVDGIVDGSLFIAQFLLANGYVLGDALFDPSIDLNMDDKINFYDYSLFNQYSITPACP